MLRFLALLLDFPVHLEQYERERKVYKKVSVSVYVNYIKRRTVCGTRLMNGINHD